MLAIGNNEYVKVCIGKQATAELSNIVREIKDVLRWLDTVVPAAEFKVTKDKHQQYYIILNGRALQYLLVYLKNVPPPEPFYAKEGAVVVPMAPDFGTKGWANSQPE